MIHYFQITHIHIFSRQTVVFLKRPCSAFTGKLFTPTTPSFAVLYSRETVWFCHDQNILLVSYVALAAIVSLQSALFGLNALVFFVLIQAITSKKSINFLSPFAGNRMLLSLCCYKIWFSKVPNPQFQMSMTFQNLLIFLSIEKSVTFLEFFF